MKWTQLSGHALARRYSSESGDMILYVIQSNGLRTRSEKDNGYSYVCAMEDAHGTNYNTEYLTDQELFQRYGIIFK